MINEQLLKINTDVYSTEDILLQSGVKLKDHFDFDIMEKMILCCMDFETKQTISVMSVSEPSVIENDFRAKMYYHTDSSLAFCLTEIVDNNIRYYRIQSWLGNELKRFVISNNDNIDIVIEKLKKCFYKPNKELIVDNKFLINIQNYLLQSLYTQYKNLKIIDEIDYNTNETTKYIKYENNILIKIKFNSVVSQFINRAVVTSYNTDKWNNEITVLYGEQKSSAIMKLKEIL